MGHSGEVPDGQSHPHGRDSGPISVAGAAGSRSWQRGRHQGYIVPVPRTDKLSKYRSKRSRERTPEPVPPDGPLPEGNDDTFVIQEHHARRLHWDFRLERNGVLVSWALPKGVPSDPAVNHLAVHTEDHPLEYGSFEGEIPRGQYGAGSMTIWDSGRYETLKWAKDEVKVRLHGQRVTGGYTLFQTGGKHWMMHRERQPLPPGLRPMLAASWSTPPPDD